MKHIPVALQIHVSPPYLAIHLEQDVGFDAGFERNDGTGTFEACENLKILVRVERDTGADLPLGAGALFGERLFRIIEHVHRKARVVQDVFHISFDDPDLVFFLELLPATDQGLVTVVLQELLFFRRVHRFEETRICEEESLGHFLAEQLVRDVFHPRVDDNLSDSSIIIRRKSKFQNKIHSIRDDVLNGT